MEPSYVVCSRCGVKSVNRFVESVSTAPPSRGRRWRTTTRHVDRASIERDSTQLDSGGHPSGFEPPLSTVDPGKQPSSISWTTDVHPRSFPSEVPKRVLRPGPLPPDTLTFPGPPLVVPHDSNKPWETRPLHTPPTLSPGLPDLHICSVRGSKGPSVRSVINYLL